MSFEPFVWKSEPPKDIPFRSSELFNEIRFTGKSRHYPVADTWYPSWASDGNCYSPFTDGVTEGVHSGSGMRVYNNHESIIADYTTQTGQAIMEGDDPLDLKLISLENQSATTYPYGGRYP